jgi:hypothetical protein
MNNLTPEQKTEAIALFDGYEKKVFDCDPYFRKNGYLLPIGQLKFHSSWDWLMPVVAKIETIEFGRFGFTVDPWSIEIIDYFENEKSIVNIAKEWEKGVDRNEYILSLNYEAVTAFLEWNETHKK